MTALLVAIEGIDGSGKGTQARRLYERLRDSGWTAELLSFPRYAETEFGRAIGRFLNGEFGDLSSVDPHLAATLYAADRFESRDLLLDRMAACDVVVLDRYVPSNMAHQGAKRSGPARAELQQWIETIEFNVFRLPRPDVVLHLDLPAERASQLIAQKSARTYTDRAADIQEEDTGYLAGVRSAYLDLSDRIPGWQVISLLDGDRLRTIDEVAELVWDAIHPLLTAKRPA